MAEYVVPVDVMARYDAIAPAAVLVGPRDGMVVLAVAPHQDDPDQRCVVLRWDGAKSAVMADARTPLSRHRLYERGLQDVAWVGVVRDSTLAGDEPDLVHHVVVVADRTLEVLARVLTVHRLPGPPAAAADAAMTSPVDGIG